LPNKLSFFPGSVRFKCASEENLVEISIEI
jgi:hypothetical protein